MITTAQWVLLATFLLGKFSGLVAAFFIMAAAWGYDTQGEARVFLGVYILLVFGTVGGCIANWVRSESKGVDSGV